MNLSKNELVDMYKTYGLCCSGNKTYFNERIALHFKSLSDVATKEEDLELNEGI